MITISKPSIKQYESKTYLLTKISNEVDGFQDVIWFSVSPIFGEYLCQEVADPFVLLVLMQAVLTQQDVMVDAPISNKLRYNLETALIHIFTYIYGLDKNHKIKVITKGEVANNYGSSAYVVATGCSLGVDSMSTIKYHTSEACPIDYRLTHLTYFNIGALGEHDLKEAEQAYQKNLRMIREYAKCLNLPVIEVESNSAILFKDFDFDQSHTIRNMATVLSLQKLIRRYIYASDFPVEHTNLSATHIGEYNQILLPLLSTDYTELIVADTDKTRTEKTRFIADDDLVLQNLYVCWRDIFSNGNPGYKKLMDSISYRNCTRCDKCLRTALALDILGVLKKYEKIFDLAEYYRVRKMYIFKVLDEQNTNIFYKELADMMKYYRYDIPKNVLRKIQFKKYHLLWLWYAIKKCVDIVK